MTGGDFRAALEQMEAWIADPNWDPDPQALAQWNAGLAEAMEQAKGTAEWSALVARAQLLGRQLEDHAARLEQLKEKVKAELEAIECGGRALRGYGARTR
jgi:flagellar hook-associated protein FlgK